MKTHTHTPLGAVGVAGSAFVVTVGVFEDEAVATLQPIRTFLHTAGPVFHVNTLHTLICTLKRRERERGGGGVERERAVIFIFCKLHAKLNLI